MPSGMPASFHTSAWSWAAPGGWDGRADAGRLAERDRVDARGDVRRVQAGHVNRQAACVLDRLDPAGHADERVGEGLAVVADDEGRELLAVLPGQLAEGEEDLAPGDEGHVAPGRERELCGLDGAVD